MLRQTLARSYFNRSTERVREARKATEGYPRQIWRVAVRRSRVHDRFDLAGHFFRAQQTCFRTKNLFDAIHAHETAVNDGSRQGVEDAELRLKQTAFFWKLARDVDGIQRENPNWQESLRTNREEILSVLAEALYRFRIKELTWPAALAFRHSGDEMPVFTPIAERREKSMDAIGQAGAVFWETPFQFEKQQGRLAELDVADRLRQNDTFYNEYRKTYRKARSCGQLEQ